jgi:hypothetical protein
MLNWIFQNSNVFPASSNEASKHLWKTCFVQSLLKFTITCWSIGWIKDVILEGSNFTLMETNLAIKEEATLGPCPGSLSKSKTANTAVLFLVWYFSMEGQKTSEAHS